MIKKKMEVFQYTKGSSHVQDFVIITNFNMPLSRAIVDEKAIQLKSTFFPRHHKGKEHKNQDVWHCSGTL